MVQFISFVKNRGFLGNQETVILLSVLKLSSLFHKEFTKESNLYLVY